MEIPQTGPVTPGSSAPGPVEAMTPLELREIFKRMVLEETQAGTLTYSRRNRLLTYARQIGLGPVQANLLIYEARREVGVELLDDPPTLTEQRSGFGILRWLIWFQLAMALAAVCFLHMLLRRIF
jgi:hypothetical protein